MSNVFLKVTHQDWVNEVRGLTGAEIKVLYYLKTLDPFGDREAEVSVTAIALELELSKGTVSKALKRLNQLGKIDLEIITAKVKVNAFPGKNTVSCKKHGFQEKTSFPIGNGVSYRKPKFPIGNPSFLQETQVSCRKQQEPETPTQQGSCNSQTNKTYKDFIDSLSLSQREKFFEFGLKKARELPKPPTLPKKWVERNWEELAIEFKKSTPADVDWSQHPHRDEWIEQIRQGRPRFVAQGGPPEERETRRQFAQWAEANNLVWGDKP
jgi:hypothetical protein